jgi:hypothetical protein
MASRKEEKERLRQQRLAAEQAERARQRRRLVIGYASAGVLVALIVVGIVIAATGGGGGSSSASDVAKQTVNPGSVPAAAEQGTRTTSPPWPPLYNGLAARLNAMGLPALNENIYHVHAWLHVYVNGKPVTVPPNVGLDVATRTFSSMHTHNAATDGIRSLPPGAGDGIIHMEADKPYPFTLGQFFAVWGVRFTDNQLGPYKAGHGNILQVYFNGKRVSDPVNQVLHEHNDISVGYGKPGSFPTKPPAHWPPGL